MTRMRTAVPATLLPYAAALQFWVLLNWNSSLAAWSCLAVGHSGRTCDGTGRDTPRFAATLRKSLSRQRGSIGESVHRNEHDCEQAEDGKNLLSSHAICPEAYCKHTLS